MNFARFFFLCLTCYISYSNQKASSYEADNRPICITDMDMINTRKRVINGDDAKMDSFRFVAQMYIPAVGNCGASLITDRHVLTAAYCVFRREEMIIGMRLNIGAFDVGTNDEAQNYIRTIKNVVVHPQFLQNRSDIAIVEFHDPVPLGTNVRTIILPPQNGHLSPGTMCTVWGWGITADGTVPEILQQANLPLKTREECQQYYNDIKPNEICAGGEGKEACNGDSGGSLLVQFNNYYVACGIVSYGYAENGCGNPNEPTIYTDVSKYTNWIYEMTKDARCKPRILTKENYH